MEAAYLSVPGSKHQEEDQDGTGHLLLLGDPGQHEKFPSESSCSAALRMEDAGTMRIKNTV